MSWAIVTDEWRMKLLAAGLAVLMLGAVAFSQNPPTSGSLTVPLLYGGIPANLVLINPPPSVTVTYQGVADAIKNVRASNLTATVDVSHARVGSNVLAVVAKSTIPDVYPQNPQPIYVQADTYVQNLPLQVQVSARPAPGFNISTTAAECPGKPCTAHFSGPAAWTKNLVAYVTYPGSVNLTSVSSPNQPINLTNVNGPLDLTACRTDPCATLDILTASIVITAVPGSNSSTVTLLDSGWSHGPAAGYRVTEVDISPNPIVLTGDPTTLGKIRSITLPANDLSGRTSNAVFQVAIPLPEGVAASVPNATVTYVIQPNPALVNPSAPPSG